MIMTLFAASEIPNPFPQSTPAQISSSNLSCFTAWQIFHSQLNNYIFIYTVILYCMSLFYCGYYGRICPTVGKCVHNNLDLRRDAVIIYRLKIGHSLDTLLLTFWRWPPNMYKVWRCIDSEAYTSGLSGTPGCPAEILHCFFSERHFWNCRQSIYHWLYQRRSFLSSIVVLVTHILL